jgi:hypothetical protein
MTRTKKLLLATLAATLFSSVAVGAEMIGANDEMAYPEPTPTVAELYDGQALAENEAPDFGIGECSGLSAPETVGCDRNVVTTN